MVDFLKRLFINQIINKKKKIKNLFVLQHIQSQILVLRPTKFILNYFFFN